MSLLENTQVYLVFSINYYNMEVEYFIDMLGYLVCLLFGNIASITIKLPVHISIIERDVAWEIMRAAT